jgi:L-lactate dehydrogenase complex protein LldG
MTTNEAPAYTLAELLALFTERLESVGGTVARAETSDDLATIVGQIADEEGIDSSVTLWMSRPLRDAAPEFAQALIASGRRVAVPDDPGSVRDQPLGLAIARAGIAETGSVVMVEPNVSDRAVTLMTQTLVIACPIAALLPSLDEAATVLREISGQGPSYATFITGPSRTADIERELTVGVQGPGKLHVVFVEDLDGSAVQPSSAA